MSEVNNETQQSLSFKTVEWEKGKIITAADLNRFEEGILNLTNNANTTNDIIANLDYSDSSAADTKFVSQVTETDGQIAVTHRDFAPSISIVAATSEQGENNSDKPRITFSVGGNPATSGDINTATTSVYGVTKLSNAIDSDSEVLAATPKAIKTALTAANTSLTNTINSLNGGVIINSPSTSNTLTALSESAGQISATFAPINITSDQISDRGSANCVATLDASGKVPSSQLPSYVDDILEGTAGTPVEGKITVFNDLNNQAYTPESGKIYVDTTSNMSYRYAGSSSGYVKVASDLTLGETEATAYRGDRGAAAYTHAVTNKGAAFTNGLYKITTNTEGHVTNATAVTKADLLAFFGSNVTASGTTSFAEGYSTTASGNNSHAEGQGTTASGGSSHAEGTNTTASETSSHAEGSTTIASGTYSHAEGSSTTASDHSAHAEGYGTLALGGYSHAEGNHTIAAGMGSHASGERTIASGKYEHVSGNYNALEADNWAPSTHYNAFNYILYNNKLYSSIAPHTSSDNFENDKTYWSTTTKFIDVIGNGVDNNNRSNARALDRQGNEYLNGNLYVNCNPDSTGGIMIGGTSNGEVQFSDGTTTVTFTMSDLQALYTLIHPNT